MKIDPYCLASCATKCCFHRLRWYCWAFLC